MPHLFTLSPSRLLCIGALLLTACGDKDDSSDTQDSVEADADADADADSDTDTDLSFSGTTTYTTTFNGAPRCDLTLGLRSVADYTGGCGDCAFVFEVEATIEQDNSAASCDYDMAYTLIPEAEGLHTFIGFWESYVGYYGSYTNLTRTGYGINDGYYYYPGPYFGYRRSGTLSYEGGAGSATWDGSALTWDLYQTESASTPSTFHTCEPPLEMGTAGPSEEVLRSNLDCTDDSVQDLWEFTGTGDFAHITVDTVADDTSFDPQLWVNSLGEQTCTVATADDNFDCSFPPPFFSCPGVILPTQSGVVYQVVVSNLGSCAGADAEYSIGLEFSADGGSSSGQESDMTLQTDDAAYSLVEVPTTLRSVGSGEVTEE